MTREEAIRTIGDVFAYAGARGMFDEGVDPTAAATAYTQALHALGVTSEEVRAVAARASAELREEGA